MTKNANNLSGRIAYIDVLRIIACLLVCLHHGVCIYLGTTRPNVLVAATLTMVGGANIFLMISGALLLPVKRAWRDFISRRVSLVAWPLLVWTIVYLVDGFAHGTMTWYDIVILPLAPANSILWYLYMIIVVYITMPAVSILIKAIGRRGVEVYLVLWLLSALMPYEHGVIHSLTPPQHPLSFFNNCYGYVILGYYLRHWPVPLFTWRHGWWILALSVLCIVGLPLFEFKMQPSLSWNDHIEAVNNNVSINGVMMSVLIFTIIQKIFGESYPSKACWSNAVVTMSKCTFGIYLSHWLFLQRVCVPVLCGFIAKHLAPGLGTELLTGVSLAIVTFLLSLLLSWLILQMPFSRRIIGR
ncbi:MAG: acyltransferase [Muribaculaceae bacterium]|nr:acyltransferase [Muribaculaceae bacterium]